MESLVSALELYRRGRLTEAEAACERLVARQPADRREVLTLLAEIRSSSGRTDAAIENLRELATLAPGDAANLRRLGAALLSIGRSAEAADVLRRAVQIEPGNVRGHNNLGQVLLRMGLPQEAIPCFERALELEPNYAIGRLNLALGLENAHRPAEALANYDRFLALHRDSALGWVRRGALLLQLDRAAEALQSFDTAVSLSPGDGEIHASRAAALLALQQPADAIAAAERALVLAAGDSKPLQYKAAALCLLQRHAEALPCLDGALEIDPGNVEVWCNRAVVFQQLGDHAAAVASYRHALVLEPFSIAAQTGLLAALIPAVALSTLESQRSRADFEAELAAFEHALEERRLDENEAWTCARLQLFYLTYQETSNKAALQRYRRASAARLAPFAARPPPPPPYDVRMGRRFRLGILSAHVYEHSVFDAITRGWLETLNRSRFETTLFSLGAKRDTAIDRARNHVDRVEATPRTLPDWARLIAAQELDALIFPEVGIHRNTLALANLRLAPLQLAAWGHPETTGLPTIDAFLSAEAFEPPGAEEHYSERLIRLPNLGVYYRPYELQPAPVDFAELGLEHRGCVFVCAGAPFKYRPEDDAVLVQIAQRLGSCTFVFFTHERRELSNMLQARLISAFAEAGLDTGLLRFIPWQPRSAFLGVLRQADVYLDTIGFSGFNTLMQAVEAQLPCVAYDGRFMRGRLGSGILRRLELVELIAADRAAYVDIAVRLGADRSYRSQMAGRMRLAAPRAYEDLRAVEALESVLLG